MKNGIESYCHDEKITLLRKEIIIRVGVVTDVMG